MTFCKGFFFAPSRIEKANFSVLSHGISTKTKMKAESKDVNTSTSSEKIVWEKNLVIFHYYLKVLIGSMKAKYHVGVIAVNEMGLNAFHRVNDHEMHQIDDVANSAQRNESSPRQKVINPA